METIERRVEFLKDMKKYLWYPPRNGSAVFNLLREEFIFSDNYIKSGEIISAPFEVLEKEESTKLIRYKLNLKLPDMFVIVIIEINKSNGIWDWYIDEHD